MMSWPAEPSSALGRLPRPILLVGSDSDQIDVLRALLQSQGYPVVLANDPLEALTRVDTHDPTLVIVDAHGPGMTGYVLADVLWWRRGQSSPAVLVLEDERPRHATSRNPHMFNFERAAQHELLLDTVAELCMMQPALAE